LPERQWQGETQKFSAKHNVQYELFYFVVRYLLWASSASNVVTCDSAQPTGVVVLESFAPTLGYNLSYHARALLSARIQWRFPELNCLPAYTIAYISIYDSFQLYHYVLSKLKWSVHKWVPTNEKNYLCDISQTRLSA